MNAKDFENHCKNLEGEGQHTVAAELRAYVAQQVDATAKTLSLAIRKRKQVMELREALARVEAALRIERMALAEAIDLIGQVLSSGDLEGRSPTLLTKLESCAAYNAQDEQQEAPKRGKPDWNSHSYDQIFQTIDGNWFGARAGWDFKGHISDGWKGREVSLLRDDGGFLAYGEQNPDWENSLEQRPVQEAQGAQAGEFQREDRYIVIKQKDLEAASVAERDWFKGALSRLEPHLPNREYLVIESDWPEYEPTWAAIQARMTGQGAQAGDERAAFRKEYDAFRQWAGSRLTARQLDLDEVGLFYDEVTGFAHDAWQARAALATQPAVRGAEQ